MWSFTRAASAIVRMCVGFEVTIASRRRIAPRTTRRRCRRASTCRRERRPPRRVPRSCRRRRTGQEVERASPDDSRRAMPRRALARGRSATPPRRETRRASQSKSVISGRGNPRAGRRSLMVDTSIVKDATARGHLVGVQGALAGRAPVLSIAASSELSQGGAGAWFAGLAWVHVQGGRISSAVGDPSRLLTLNSLVPRDWPKLSTEDAFVLASAEASGLDILASDRGLVEFTRWAHWMGYTTTNAEYYQKPGARAARRPGVV